MTQVSGTHAPQRHEILGVPVDLVDMASAIAHIRNLLATQETHLIVAVNPEKVIAAQNNPELLQCLREASLVIPDGIGVVMAVRILGRQKLDRVPGSDLMPELCRVATTDGYRVFLFGAKPEVNARTAEILKSRYPGLQIAGMHHGYVAEDDMGDLIARINASNADILFVGLGSPRQEYWMRRHRDQLDVRVCQGVGGTFDALCGHPKRAPKILQRLHLEWLYRLVTQPQRLARQSALPRFAGQVIRRALSGK